MIEAKLKNIKELKEKLKDTSFKILDIKRKDRKIKILNKTIIINRDITILLMCKKCKRIIIYKKNQVINTKELKCCN